MCLDLAHFIFRQRAAGQETNVSRRLRRHGYPKPISHSSFILSRGPEGSFSFCAIQYFQGVMQAGIFTVPTETAKNRRHVGQRGVLQRSASKMILPVFFLDSPPNALAQLEGTVVFRAATSSGEFSGAGTALCHRCCNLITQKSGSPGPAPVRSPCSSLSFCPRFERRQRAVPAPENSPDEVAARNELFLRLRQCVGGLSEKHPANHFAALSLKTPRCPTWRRFLAVPWAR